MYYIISTFPSSFVCDMSLCKPAFSPGPAGYKR